MARFRDVWNSYRIVQAERGTFRAVYHPGAPHEYVIVVGPGEETKQIATPALGDFQLAAEGSEIVVRYVQIEGAERVERAIRTGIACGHPVGNAGTGPAGPAGPAGPKGDQGPRGEPGATGPAGQGADVTDEQMQRIAAFTAERVHTYPAAPDHFGITPPEAQSGLYLQDAITVLLSNQAVAQLFIRALDEAALNLLQGGYQPKVGG